VSLLASIPSPSSGTIDIGPLSLPAYGLMIALGVVAAVWLTGRRLEARGAGTRDDVSSMAVWAVLAGVIGSRLYHVATEWSSFQDRPLDALKIWQGGLGIPGGLLAGIVVGIWATKRRGVDWRVMVTCAAPAIPLAQSIGRWGNWFNQELYGKATTLPWGLEISPGRVAAAGYPPGTLFHPTFLYESLWNLALCGFLLLLDKRRPMRPPRLMGVYLLGYGIGRFWVEGLRIDATSHVGGLRWNQWVALAVIVGSVVYLVVSGRSAGHDSEAADEHGDAIAEEHDSEAADDSETADVTEVADEAEVAAEVADAPVPESGPLGEGEYVPTDEPVDER
jgi:prolipoprotein diacylglyceryl transferase